ncbi:hypothetical protein [Agriterribacter sp.]|uniref:hypothetical protein n=1 Tax=Agriterribacter sp. TaxID=2821509 RepID=UPI002BFD956D|nr:hypothetical protein [Agriterribacter sp.]HRP55470.1 hypothetical protein [Agriterribacter sp.]
MMANSSPYRLKDGGLRIGWAAEDITPDGPVSLYGQYYERISEYVQSRLTVTACAIEKTTAGGRSEQAILVSMDVIYALKEMQDAVRTRLQGAIPDIDLNKIFLNATHTHSAPYPEVESRFGEILLNGICKVVVNAWENRKSAAVSTGFDYAVIGHNRRVMYADGNAEMYGDTEREDFLAIEGPTDPGIDLLFTWDLDKQLTGIWINVACPAQVTESKYYVSSDFWSEVRKNTAKRFGKDIFILPQCGAAGDIAPRDLTTRYRAGEPDMWDVPGIVEIGKRIDRVIQNVYPSTLEKITSDVVFYHQVRQIRIPTRIVSDEEYRKALAVVNTIKAAEPADPYSPHTAWNRFLKEIKDNEKIKTHGPWDSKTSDYGWLRPMEIVVQQYEDKHRPAYYEYELHVMRINDVALATNSFELFVDYGFAITARNKAKQTFIVQFAGDSGGYLPTQRALNGGGYSAMANNIGPDGGKVLVEETIAMINAMWDGDKH